jgi:DNA-binding NarL/FixJ family response regulator
MSLDHNASEGASPAGSRPPWVTRVYIVDDHRFFTFALTTLINCEADLAVCGSGSEQNAVVGEVGKLAPDIVVIDVNLARQDGLAMAAALRQVAQGVPILFVSSLQNPQFEVDSRWLEPCSFVEKTKDPVDIIHGIRQTLAKFRLFQSQLPTNP